MVAQVNVMVVCNFRNFPWLIMFKKLTYLSKICSIHQIVLIRIYNFKLSNYNQMKTQLNLLLTFHTLILLFFFTSLSLSLATNNICTFSIQDKFFSFLTLQQDSPYKYQLKDNQQIELSFCQPFIPQKCPKDTVSGLSFIVKQVNGDIQNVSCESFSSQSTIFYYNATYQKINTKSYLVMNYSTPDNQPAKNTILNITCSQQKGLKIEKVTKNNNTLYIMANSLSGCPIFQISNIWKALSDNEVLFGLILLILGIQSLFFGRTMLVVTIFIAGYLLSFALMAALATTFIGPNSRLLLIYFTLIVIMFVSTIMAYGITKLVGISIFFIGAWFGFIVGALFNSLFSGIFHIYSSTTLIIFQILFMIPCGLLTFRYSDEIIILSTSITGSYMVVRPISWILGGFPNEFLLEQLYQSGRLNTIPASFFIYLIFIVALSIIGALYQFLKLRRQDTSKDVQVTFFEEKIENSVDKVKNAIDGIIARYKSSSEPENEAAELQEVKNGKRFSDYNKI